MLTWLCHLFAILLVSSAAAVLRDSVGCLWRFHECSHSPRDLQCLVHLRLWCVCSDQHNATCDCTTDNTTASCDGETELEVNTSTAHEILSSNGEGQLRDFCRVSTCSVVRQHCQWSPWRPYSLNMLVRHRKTCCHPVTKTEMVTAFFCYPEREFKYCGHDITECTAFFPNFSEWRRAAEQSRAAYPAFKNGDETDDVTKIKPWQIALICIACPFVITLFVTICRNPFKRRKPHATAVYQKMPDDAVYLQPGEPIPVGLLPANLREPLP